MNGIHHPLPKARRNHLVRKELGREMLVYDRNSDKAHCLNATAARVWAQCDGRTTVAEMARLLEDEMKTPVADEIVWFALEQLRKSHLLQESWSTPAQVEQMSRRVMVRRLGIAAAVTVPLVTSIIAPTAVAAATCILGQPGATCVNDGDCCSNSCVDNGRGVFQCT
ncbi:MAG TPA: PqqD family protein [Pyrinomonadaceae bacterium]|nr:PqqD family protein [Pyrinomonadaceae bacterium]